MTASADILLQPFEVVSCYKCGQPCDVLGFAPFDRYTCATCGAEWVVPARFANFIVLEQLGKGGMGAVYRAFDETLNRTVALKVMQRRIGQDRAFVSQFLQEARALAAINSPNIVQIYNYGEEDGQPYIVMELVDGDRLDHIHAKKHDLDERYVLDVAIQVCRGMQAANDAGMTHGDIKPANILFDKAGHAKVSDFGLARLKGERPKPGEIWGTPYYVSPEVVRGQAPNAASDIYSLGGTLYHLLTGEPPFNGETVNDTVLLRFKEPAPDPREFKPSVSAPTAAILLRMLEADPSLRYPNYASLLIDLQRARDALDESRSGKKQAEASKVVSILVTGALVLVLLGIVGFVVVHAVHVHEKKIQEQAQFEKDKREGRLVQRIVNGHLQWVKAPPPAPTPAPASQSTARPGQPAAATATATTDRTIVPSLDFDVPYDEKSIPKRSPAALFLRAGNQGIDKASIVYLQFVLQDFDLATVTNAVLRLTFGDKTSANRSTTIHDVSLWALNADVALPPIPVWGQTPAALAESAADLNPEQAIRLAKIRIPANPRTGDKLTFDDPALAQFIAAYPGHVLTFVLTATDATDQKGGWRFAASEDAQRFAPPTLLLKTAPTP